MKKVHWFEVLLVGILLTISVYAAFSDAHNLSWRWFTRDDAYYYFKVAQNISEGHGSTFDGINRTNGYHPLWMMVCVPIFALARFDLILPLRVLLLVLGVLSAATAVLFYRLLGKIFHPTIGALAALFWAFNYDILTRVYMQGLETGLALFLVLLLVYKLYEFETNWRNGLVTNRQLFNLGWLALLVVFSRLDLIFLAGMAGIWIIFRRSPVRYLLPLDIASLLVAVFLAFILRLAIPDFREYFLFKDAALTMAVVSVMVKIPLAYFMGLYNRSLMTTFKSLVARLALFAMSGSVVTGVLMLILARVEHFEGFPRITLAYDLLLTTLFFGSSRLSLLALKTTPPASYEPTPLSYFRNNWKQWLNEGFAYFGVIAAGLASYMLYNKFAFGSYSPVSGQIKRWWGSLPGRVYDGSVSDPLSFFGITYLSDANTFHPVTTLFGRWAEALYQIDLSTATLYLLMLFAFASLYYGALFIDKHKAKSAFAQLSIIPLLSASLLQVLYYHAPGYSAYKEWYWISQLVLIVFAFSILLGLLHNTLHRVPHLTTISWTVTTLFGLYMLLPFWSAIRANMTYGEWQADDPINEIAAFLEEHTEPGSIIGFTGGGNAGYFIHDRTVINMDGLINSNTYFQLLQEQKAGEFFATEGMDYILANNALLEQLPYKGQFAPYIEFTDENYGGKNLLRYRTP